MTRASSFLYGADGFPVIIKDPDALLDYSVDWTEWLSASEMISVSAWAVESATGAPTVSTDGLDDAAKVATVWLAGGTAGSSYLITNSIETDQGRSENRSFKIHCKER